MNYRSKYDGFWLNIIDILRDALEEAYKGSLVSIDIRDIAKYSRRSRNSWYGKIIICRDRIVKDNIMVHIRSLARIILSNGLLDIYDSCFSFTVTRDLVLVIKKIENTYENTTTRLLNNLNNEKCSQKTLFPGINYLLGSKIFRDKPLGPECICDHVFEGFKWYKLSSLRSTHLPCNPGVYVIRVIERGDDAINVMNKLQNIILETGWTELIEYVRKRVNRILKIKECPVLYIGSTDNIRSRFKDLAGIRHTAFFPILALLLGNWDLDYGFKTTSTKEKAIKLEEKLKKKYIKIHGFLPALVEI